MYVIVVALDSAAYTAHRCFGVPTPPVLSYYSNLVLRPCGAQWHLILVVARTEFVVWAILRFLLATRDGALSMFDMGSNM